jgi:hypothetical protein
MKKKAKWKIGHGKSEEKCEFESPWNESLRFKCDPQSCLDLKVLLPSKLQAWTQ